VRAFSTSTARALKRLVGSPGSTTLQSLLVGALTASTGNLQHMRASGDFFMGGPFIT
jgi:hypothetical protein